MAIRLPYSDGVSLATTRPGPERYAVVSAADRELGDLRLALVGRNLRLVVDACGLGERLYLREVTDGADRPLSTSRGLGPLEAREPELRRRL